MLLDELEAVLVVVEAVKCRFRSSEPATGSGRPPPTTSTRSCAPTGVAPVYAALGVGAVYVLGG
jgi:hypothetical protein